MENILEVSNLNKTYSHFSLRDLSFSLPEGCITGLIGVNGAGKTTTIKTLLGLSQKDAGSVRFFGMNMDTHATQIKQRLGIVFDDGCFYEDLSLIEMKNIIAPAYKNWSDKDFNTYMQRFALSKDQKIHSLSKGMRIKYALALALSHKAELLIMDEPTSGLDPLIRSQLLSILQDFMAMGGKGIFFSTHITSDLDKIADMLIMIDHGQIVLQKDKDTLLDTYRIVKAGRKSLSPSVRPLLINITENAYGFTAITKEAAAVRKMVPDALMERPSIEDIMLCHISH